VNGLFVIQGVGKCSGWAVVNKVEKIRGGGDIQDGKFRDSLGLLGCQIVLCSYCGVSS